MNNCKIIHHRSLSKHEINFKFRIGQSDIKIVERCRYINVIWYMHATFNDCNRFYLNHIVLPFKHQLSCRSHLWSHTFSLTCRSNKIRLERQSSQVVWSDISFLRCAYLNSKGLSRTTRYHDLPATISGEVADLFSLARIVRKAVYFISVWRLVLVYKSSTQTNKHTIENNRRSEYTLTIQHTDTYHRQDTYNISHITYYVPIIFCTNTQLIIKLISGYYRQRRNHICLGSRDLESLEPHIGIRAFNKSYIY